MTKTLAILQAFANNLDPKWKIYALQIHCKIMSRGVNIKVCFFINGVSLLSSRCRCTKPLPPQQSFCFYFWLYQIIVILLPIVRFSRLYLPALFQSLVNQKQSLIIFLSLSNIWKKNLGISKVPQRQLSLDFTII